MPRLPPLGRGGTAVRRVRAEGHQGSKPASGMFGGRGALAVAVVTWTLVGLNVLLYLVEWIRPGLANDMEMLGLGRFTRDGPLVGVATGQWYRLITSAFLPPPGMQQPRPA